MYRKPFQALALALLALAGTATAAVPLFEDINAGLTGVVVCSLAWGDYDNDGDLDLALAGETDFGSMPVSKIYRNDAGAFTDINAGLTAVNWCSLAWGDYDSDGDLDLALAGSGVSIIYRNDGGAFVDIGAGLTGVKWSSLAWGDYDNDGDLDLAVAGYTGTVRLSLIYRNDGGTFTDINAGLTGVGDCSLAWGDYDNDGDLDLALAGWAGSIRVSKIYRNNGSIFNAAPTAPTGLSATNGSSDVTFSWTAATDPQTPTSGLYYNLRVGTTPGGNEITAGMADSASGYRRIPAIGNAQQSTSWTLKGLPGGTNYWSVQAIDTAWAGSMWTTENSFSVNQSPQIQSGPVATPNPTTNGSTTVSVIANDPDAGPMTLTYTWSLVSGPGIVSFSPNGTATSDSSTVLFSVDGTYTLRVTVSDGALTDTGDVVVTVDMTAPSVDSTVPADTTTGVATNATVQVTFSEAMDQTATEAAFSIIPAATGSFSWNVPGDTLTFTPSADLTEGTTYTVTIGSGAADVVGNNLAAPYSFSLTTVQPPPSADSDCGCAPPAADKTSKLQHSIGAALGFVLLAFLAAWARTRTRVR